MYNDIYQLQRSPGKSPSDAEMKERICQEILDFVKECLWHRWDCTQPEEEARQSSTGLSRLDPQPEFQDRMHDHFKDLKEGLCKDGLVVACDAHQWELAATALLEEKVERLNHSLSSGHWHSRSHKCLASCHQRSQAGSHQDRAPPGGSTSRRVI